MSALALARPADPAHRVREVLSRWRGAEPAFFGLGLLLLAAMAPMGAAAVLDDRTFGGVDIWLKPLKFAFALGVYLLTLAFYALALPAGFTARRGWRAFRAAVMVAIVAEMAWIAGAAAAGTASHFNGEGLWAVVYPVMGLFATLLTSATAVLAVGIARNPRTGLPPAVRDGLVGGLALTLPLTLLTAGIMSGMGGHLVGAASDAGGWPVFGWSREVGDLRVAHFLGTHAMHALPMAGLALAWAGSGHRRAPVWALGAAYAALVLFALLQALAGRPFP